MSQKDFTSLEILNKCSESWNDYNVQILYSDIYAKKGDMDRALMACDQAYNMVPCRFEPLYRKMLLYGYSNDTINVVRTAYEILEKPIKVHSDQLNHILSSAEQMVSVFDN